MCGDCGEYAVSWCLSLHVRRRQDIAALDAWF